ncbi:MAG: NUDIX domain-containing protein, partial [Chloroflexota bacterium]
VGTPIRLRARRRYTCGMSKKLTHAGCVSFRTVNGARRFLAVTSSNGNHWVLPQGHIEEGETPDQAALRELIEEAGVVGEIVSKLSIREYQKPNEEVVIQYFLIRARESVPAHEGRVNRWEEEDASLNLLSFEAAREAVREGAKKIASFSAEE